MPPFLCIRCLKDAPVHMHLRLSAVPNVAENLVVKRRGSGVESPELRI